MAAPSDPRRPSALPPVWRQADGQPVSCVEKIKVLNENLVEIRQMCQDAFEDGLLMGCDERQLRAALAGIVRALVNPFPTAGPPAAEASPGGDDDGEGEPAEDA
jgi:hypothetical protein